jgi:group I intron endonuclease
MYIYQITNKLTNDSYVGKTINQIEKRFYQHKYNALNNKSQTYLHRSIRKYGEHNFTISLLDEANNISELNQKEIDWIENISPKYNMTKGGDGGDNSSSPNFIESMRKYHESCSPKNYATYGMLGKQQSDKFFKSIKESNSCPVMCEGVKFDSVGEAQSAYPGISIRKRIDSSKYPDFYRLGPKTKRK